MDCKAICFGALNYGIQLARININTFYFVYLVFI